MQWFAVVLFLYCAASVSSFTTVFTILRPLIKSRVVRSTRTAIRMSSNDAYPVSLPKSANPSAIRVTTYNVLSSHLAEPGYFTKCNPSFLDPVYRLKKLKEKLDHETSADAIICLQEVSHLWAGALTVYFAAKGYSFTTALYGNKFNNYMGVGIAAPYGKYDILDANIQRIGDTKRNPTKSDDKRDSKKDSTKESNGNGGILSKIKNLFRRITGGSAKDKEKEEPYVQIWQDTLRRHNQMICMKFQSKQGDNKLPFVVGTYHMPCAFRTPALMMIHCALSAQHIHNFSQDSPYIYCGDFNIKPESTMYTMMTTGLLSDDNQDSPAHLYNNRKNKTQEEREGTTRVDHWKAVAPIALQSAYMVVNGQEPDFTNYAQIKDDAPFIDTLDYIFMGNAKDSQWRVESVLPLPSRDHMSVKGPYPAQEEPSDHVLLTANLEIVKGSE